MLRLCFPQALQSTALSSTRNVLCDGIFRPQIPIPQRRCERTSCNTLTQGSNSDRNINKITSVTWTRIYDRSPVSYEVNTFDGYLEIILPEHDLPCEKTENLESVFDYISQVSWSICSRMSLLHAPVELAHVKSSGIWVAERSNAQVRVTIKLDKSLYGSFKAQRGKGCRMKPKQRKH